MCHTLQPKTICGWCECEMTVKQCPSKTVHRKPSNRCDLWIHFLVVSIVSFPFCHHHNRKTKQCEIYSCCSIEFEKLNQKMIFECIMFAENLVYGVDVWQQIHGLSIAIKKCNVRPTELTRKKLNLS